MTIPEVPPANDSEPLVEEAIAVVGGGGEEMVAADGKIMAGEGAPGISGRPPSSLVVSPPRSLVLVGTTELVVAPDSEAVLTVESPPRPRGEIPDAEDDDS